MLLNCIVYLTNMTYRGLKSDPPDDCDQSCYPVIPSSHRSIILSSPGPLVTGAGSVG